MIENFYPQKIQSTSIDANLFSLLSRNSDDKSKFDVEINFSAKIINDFVLAIPKYNFDQNPLTGGFKRALEKEQTCRDESTNVETQQLNNRLQNITQKRIEIFEPKPSHNFCQVCKESFMDYAKHIIHKVHIKNIKKSPFNQQIEDLITKFHRKPTRNAVSSELGELTQKRRIVEGSDKAPVALKMNKDPTESTHCSNGHFNNQKQFTY